MFPVVFDIDDNGEANGTVHWYCSQECAGHHGEVKNWDGDTANGLTRKCDVPDQSRCEYCRKDVSSW